MQCYIVTNVQKMIIILTAKIEGQSLGEYQKTIIKKGQKTNIYISQ